MSYCLCNFMETISDLEVFEAEVDFFFSFTSSSASCRSCKSLWLSVCVVAAMYMLYCSKCVGKVWHCGGGGLV